MATVKLKALFHILKTKAFIWAKGIANLCFGNLVKISRTIDSPLAESTANLDFLKLLQISKSLYLG